MRTHKMWWYAVGFCSVIVIGCAGAGPDSGGGGIDNTSSDISGSWQMENGAEMTVLTIEDDLRCEYRRYVSGPTASTSMSAGALSEDNPVDWRLSEVKRGETIVGENSISFQLTSSGELDETFDVVLTWAETNELLELDLVFTPGGAQLFDAHGNEFFKTEYVPAITDSSESYFCARLNDGSVEVQLTEIDDWFSVDYRRSEDGGGLASSLNVQVQMAGAASTDDLFHFEMRQAGDLFSANESNRFSDEYVFEVTDLDFRNASYSKEVDSTYGEAFYVVLYYQSDWGHSGSPNSYTSPERGWYSNSPPASDGLLNVFLDNQHLVGNFETTVYEYDADWNYTGEYYDVCAIFSLNRGDTNLWKWVNFYD